MDYLKILTAEITSYLDELHISSSLFEKPNTVGWKVADIAEFNKILAELVELGVGQAHLGRVNDRYIASIVLNEDIMGVSVLKLMQRRPGSDDPTGLDHVDFLVDSMEQAESELEGLDVTYELESNDKHSWYSVMMHGREAKLVDHTVLDVCIAELGEARDSLIAKA